MYEYFAWDYTNIAPIRAISTILRKNPTWKIFRRVCYDGTSQLECYLAPSKQDAENGMFEEWKDAIEDAMADDEKWSPGKIIEWEDG